MESIFQIDGPYAHVGGFRPYVNDALLVGTAIVIGQAAIARATADGPTDHNIGIIGVHRDVTTLTAARLDPIHHSDGPAGGQTGDTHGAIILLRGIQMIRLALVGKDMIELRSGLVIQSAPGDATIKRYTSAAIVTLDHTAWVIRINP